MNGIEALSASPAVEATSRALVHFLWQGALLGLATGWALSLLKWGKASVRYAVAAGALFLMAALPAATALWLAENPAASAVAFAVAAEELVPSQEAAGPAEAAIPVALSVTVPSRDLIPSALPWVFGIWLAGVAGLSVYHLGGWRLARALRSRGTRPVSREMEERLRDLARRMGIARAVSFVESSALAVPAVVGVLRPVILVPASTLAGLSPRQLEAILAHELAHVRRHDYLVNLLQTVVETVLFYHPAVWWVSAQVRRERENCCDDLAVAACGDRLGYARALVDLEGLRALRPRLAMAADGGSLVERIRRLAGVPARGARRSPNSWMAGLLALSLLPMAVTFNLLADPPAVRAQETAAASRGTWTAQRKGNGKIQVEMKMSSPQARWVTSSTYNESAFQGLGAGPEARFELRRDAGTFQFQGRFEGSQGTGFFTFKPNPSYVRDMEALGYDVSEKQLLNLGLHDVSLGFVRQVRDLGYDKIRLEQLVDFRIHGVTPEFVRAIQELGYRNITAEQLEDFRIHRVTPEFVREIQELGYRDITAEQLEDFRIHRVTPEFVREIQELGYRDIAAEQLEDFRIHRVTPEFIREIQALGYRGIAAEQLEDFRIHRVTPEYIRELQSLGYRDLHAGQLEDFRVHGIDAEFIRKAMSQGHKNLSAEDLIDLKIHGRLDR